MTFLALIVLAILLVGIGSVLAPAVSANEMPVALDEELLLNSDVTPLTASGGTTAKDLGSGFAPGGGGLPMQGVVRVTAIDTTTGNETYKVELEDSADNSTFVKRSAQVTITAAGVVMVQGFVHSRYVRLYFTLAGTTPILTPAKCYLSPFKVK